MLLRDQRDTADSGELRARHAPQISSACSWRLAGRQLHDTTVVRVGNKHVARLIHRHVLGEEQSRERQHHLRGAARR
jgi:hypothetical protein